MFSDAIIYRIDESKKHARIEKMSLSYAHAFLNYAVRVVCLK